MHSIRCAVHVRDAGGSDELSVASALHDIGKLEARLGTFGRVGATLVDKLVPGDRVRRWAGGGGVAGRIGTYIDHDRLGAAMLAAAGASSISISWARDHHLPTSAEIDAATFELLVAADHA